MISNFIWFEFVFRCRDSQPQVGKCHIAHRPTSLSRVFYSYNSRMPWLEWGNILMTSNCRAHTNGRYGWCMAPYQMPYIIIIIILTPRFANDVKNMIVSKYMYYEAWIVGILDLCSGWRWFKIDGKWNKNISLLYQRRKILLWCIVRV